MDKTVGWLKGIIAQVPLEAIKESTLLQVLQEHLTHQEACLLVAIFLYKPLILEKKE